MTVETYIRQCMAQLSAIYDGSESRWLMRITLQHIKGWSQTDILLKSGDEIDRTLTDRVDKVIERLLQYEPIQYILGETYWHGLTLKVNPAVLIPRAETSELVDIISKDAQGNTDLNVLDICTGSGCIAIALARSLNFPRITATDISQQALDVARENARDCKVRIDFAIEDALKPSHLPENSFDIVVSNPPYITQSEDKLMDMNVLDYEPHNALFVPDNDPLRFYKAISNNAMRLGRNNCTLYLEINPLFSSQLCEMLDNDGWSDTQVIKDIHGKNRFISTHRQT